MDNYPDDIRGYDGDPDSPFYVEPTYECDECCEEYECFTAESDTLCNECFEEGMREEHK